MAQYRLLRDHESMGSRAARLFDVRLTLIVALGMVCFSCIYWIQHTDSEMCFAVVKVPEHISPDSAAALSVISIPLSDRDLAKQSLHNPSIYKRFVVYTEKCRVPFHDHNDPEVIDKFFSEKPEQCSKKEKPFIFYPKMDMAGGFSCVGVDETLYEKFYRDSFQLKTCTYRVAERATHHFKIDYYHQLTEPKPLEAGACPSDDLLWIECGAPNTTNSYRQPLLLPMVKPVTSTVRDNNLGQKPLHVLVIGVGSLSRLNVHRQLPKTVAYLQRWPNLVELFGYNKLGLHPGANQMPLLTGIPFKEFEEPGFAHRASRTHFDNLTRFLWDDFSSRGYRSLFLEEQWIYGLFLQPPLNGFLNVPTTYWPRPLIQALDASKMKKGKCLGPDLGAKHWLDYIHNTLKILGDERPLFAYAWFSEAAHEQINGAQAIDEYLLDFFTKLSNDRILDNTAVFFLSDHGMHHDSFRNTPLGRFEDMLPCGFVLMPDRFHEVYPQAKRIMDINSRRLLTVMDLHASLLELADVWDEDRLIRTANAYSIFSNIIPAERTCAHAGIDIEFCACYHSNPENTNTHHAWSMGSHIVDELNLKLKRKNATQCSEYKLANVTEFIRLSEGADWTNYYKAVVELEPYAVFEVTSEQRDPSTLDWSIISDFDRIDKFGLYSKCVQGLSFEKYCHCK